MNLKPRRVWFLFAVPSILVVVIYGLVSTAPKPPRYQGKTFYEWASELQQAQANYTTPDQWRKIESTSAAIRAIGTNGLPFVMADLRAEFSVKDRMIGWLSTHARFLNLKLPSVADRWTRGIRVMEVLGPLGKPYLPEIITMVSNSTGYSEGALLAIGVDALPAFTNLLAHSNYPQTGKLIGSLADAVYARRIPPEEAAVALPYLVQVFQSTDRHGRWYAASAFGAIHQDPDVCVPLLISGLTDPTPSVREICVQSLGGFGEGASLHVAELAIPALTRAAEDPRNVVRVMAVQSLGMFGPQATNALTVLERACSDADPAVRSTATNAVFRVKASR